MAHCGRELVLERAGAFGFFRGLEQGLLGAFLQSDIVEYDPSSLERTIFTPQGPAGPCGVKLVRSREEGSYSTISLCRNAPKRPCSKPRKKPNAPARSRTNSLPQCAMNRDHRLTPCWHSPTFYPD